MTTGESSCRPARLERFEETVHALCDGLVTRAGLLDDALATYQASCDSEYRAPTAGTGEIVRAVAAGLRDAGEWTGGVAAAFRKAMEDAGIDGWGDALERPMTLADSAVLAELDDWDDPFRGVPEGMAAQLAADLGVDYDPDGPPAWVDVLGNGGTVADVVGPLLKGTEMGIARLPSSVTVTLQVEAGTVAVFADGSVVARLSQAELRAQVMLPGASAPRLATASNWVGRVGFALAFAASAGQQWHLDAGWPSHERVARATTRGLGVATGAAGGGAAGFAVGGACGPAAFVCSPVLGIAGAVAGGILGDSVVEAFPYMDGPDPGEHDLDAMADAIAAETGDMDARLQAQADLGASDLAVLATADQASVNERVIGILPDDDVLERIIAFDDGSAPPWVSTGTTTTTTTTPSQPPPEPVTSGGAPPPDPWVGDRPGER